MLRKDLPSNSLARVNFTVFGLGDSGYPIYNAVARKLFQRLLDLGAQAFHERGLGDDQHELGVDGALNPWLTGLWQKLLELHPLPAGKALRENKPQPAYTVSVVPKNASPSGSASSNAQVNAKSDAAPMEVDASSSNASAKSDSEASSAPSSALIANPARVQLPAFIDGILRYTPFPARMLTNQRLTASDHYQDVRHIEFDLTGSELTSACSCLQTR